MSEFVASQFQQIFFFLIRKVRRLRKRREHFRPALVALDVRQYICRRVRDGTRPVLLRKCVQDRAAALKRYEHRLFRVFDDVLFGRLLTPFLFRGICERVEPLAGAKSQRLAQCRISGLFVLEHQCDRFFSFRVRKRSRVFSTGDPEMVYLLVCREQLERERRLRRTFLLRLELAFSDGVTCRIRAPLTRTVVEIPLHVKDSQYSVPDFLGRKTVAVARLRLEKRFYLRAYVGAEKSAGIASALVAGIVHDIFAAVCACAFFDAFRRKHFSRRAIALSAHVLRIAAHGGQQFALFFVFQSLAVALVSAPLYEQHEHRRELSRFEQSVQSRRTKFVDVMRSRIRRYPVRGKQFPCQHEPERPTAKSPAQTSRLTARFGKRSAVLWIFRRVEYPRPQRENTLRFAVFISFHGTPADGSDPDVQSYSVKHNFPRLFRRRTSARYCR